jgi:hypothetical protein
MKTLKNLVMAAILSGSIIASAFAGSWGYSVTSGGSYSTNLSVPSTGYVTISLENYGGMSYNYGPLGNYSVGNGQWFNNQGYCDAGTYYIYLAVMGSGWSGTSITW